MYTFRNQLGLAALAMVAVLTSAQDGHAQTCTAQADCPERFRCEVVGQTGCDTKPCAAGQACPAPEPCEPQDIKACKSPDCTADDDCPEHMVCFAQTQTRCSTPGQAACKPNEVCADAAQPVPPTCTEITERGCVPRYVPPCKQAADCGPGFDCKELTQCTCSGGSSVSADGGVTQTQPTQCECHPTGQSACQLQSIVCNTASDCPTDFSCDDDPNHSVCSSVGRADAPANSAGANPTGAGAAPDCPDAGEPKQVCLPPYYAFSGRGLSKGGAGDSEQHSNAGIMDAGSPTVAIDASTSTARKHSRGCSLAADASDGWLALLPLLAMLRRRRGR